MKNKSLVTWYIYISDELKILAQFLLTYILRSNKNQTQKIHPTRFQAFKSSEDCTSIFLQPYATSELLLQSTFSRKITSNYVIVIFEATILSGVKVNRG